MTVSPDWLVFPPAVDFVNSRIDSPTGVVDLLDSRENAEIWVSAMGKKMLTARAIFPDLPETREYRDEITEVLESLVGNVPWSSGQVNRLNVNAARFRPYLAWDHGNVRRIEDLTFDSFTGEIATSVFQIASESAEALNRCTAPSCGGFFMAHDSRQRWCTPTCGNRARVARHKTRQKGRNAPTN